MGGIRHGVMTKPPMAPARTALEAARGALETYSARRSRHDFTQQQLFAILVLRQFFKTDCRGIVVLIEDLPDFRTALALSKVPHFTALQKAEQRLIQKTLSASCSTLCSILPVTGG